MNTTELKANGYKTIGELKQKFLMLTDSDLLLMEDKQDEILVRLHKEHVKTKDGKCRFIFEA